MGDPKEKTKRVIALVDGFNLYHSISDVNGFHIYKWLDVGRLISLFLKSDEYLGECIYFTAEVRRDVDALTRQRKYISVLGQGGIKIELGRFQDRDRKCKECKKIYTDQEEKETDVNIASTLLKMAHNKSFDVALILTADGDQVPAIKTSKLIFPGGQIRVIIPFAKKAKRLKDACGGGNYHKIKEDHLRSSILPNSIKLSDTRIITCPVEWTSDHR